MDSSEKPRQRGRGRGRARVIIDLWQGNAGRGTARGLDLRPEESRIQTAWQLQTAPPPVQQGYAAATAPVQSGYAAVAAGSSRHASSIAGGSGYATETPGSSGYTVAKDGSEYAATGGSGDAAAAAGNSECAGMVASESEYVAPVSGFSYAAAAEASTSKAQPTLKQPRSQVQPSTSDSFRSGKVHRNTTNQRERTSTIKQGGKETKKNNEKRALVHTRPDGFQEKKGTSGAPVRITTNYFNLLTSPKWTVYQYRVEFSPDETRTNVRRSLLSLHKAKLKGYIFDGSHIYTPFRISPNLMKLCSKQNNGVPVNINIKHVGEIGYGDYVYIQVFNIIMRRCYATLKLHLIGRDFFDQMAKIHLAEHKIQIWPGYKTTISQRDGGIIMVAEIIHKILRTDTVLDNIHESLRLHKANYKKEFTEEICGQIVLTTYKNNTYLVDDIAWDVNPCSTFPKNGEQISYVQYYKETYNIHIKDLQQPLIVSLPKPKDKRRGCSNFIYLIPELCQMTGLSNTMKKNFQLMKTIATHTHISPNSRVKKLLEFNKRLMSSSSCQLELKNWDMKLDQNLLEIEGRELLAEKICSGKDGFCKYVADNDNIGWSKHIQRTSMISMAAVPSWAVITLKKFLKETQNFVAMMQESAKEKNWKLPRPTIFHIPDDSIAVYVSEIEKVLSQNNPALLMCIIQSNKIPIYNAIKKKCCVDRAVPTQIVVAKTILHPNIKSIVSNLLVQLNCKMGGAPWTVRVPIKNLMVIGYDVCHDPKDRNQSYGAMVASLNDHHTKYFNCASHHAYGEELAPEFSLNIRKSIQQYFKINQRCPSTIVIYRDGVGEGQIPHVHKNEVEVINSTLKNIYGEQPYRLQFTIVSKRINSRFFVNNTNPKPGTVIDSIVTSPERYDFFLISQAVKNGAVVPTNYNIIYDTTGLTPDMSQMLAYKMCHMYYNYTGQVRVPAPCQYAHKLAFLVSQNIRQTYNESLNMALFFL